MRAHKSHLIVAVLGEMRTIQERTLILTKIIAASIECHNTAGVYYGDGGLVHSPDYFCVEAKKASRDDLPISLWIDFRLTRNTDQTYNLITTGLEVFGYMEIEILEAKADPDDMLSMATGTAWLLLKGEIIRNGDTVGFEDTNQKIKTTHEKSVWDRPGKVLRIWM